MNTQQTLISEKRHLLAVFVSNSYGMRFNSWLFIDYLIVFVHLDLAQIYRQT
jgi:hypothetical protein